MHECDDALGWISFHFFPLLAFSLRRVIFYHSSQIDLDEEIMHKVQTNRKGSLFVEGRCEIQIIISIRNDPEASIALPSQSMAFKINQTFACEHPT